MIKRKKRWIIKSANPKIREYIKSKGYSDLIAEILSKRFSENELELIDSYLNKSLNDLCDPFLFNDMKKIVKMIKKHSSTGILIAGDYDVDGISAITILHKIFSALKIPTDYYLPDRFEEGYGFNENAIKYAKKKNFNLIITVDCGIKSIEEVKKCKRNNIDIIITDHHIPAKELPQADAILNPHMEGEKYPFKDLCGAGIAFKLAHALWLEYEKPFNPTNYYPLSRLFAFVALATIADIVPLIGENRIFVSYGLKEIEKTPNKGLRELMKISQIENQKLYPYHIGFILGPRLNASGRLEHAKQAVELLISNDINEIKKISRNLDNLNAKRQKIEKETVKEIFNIIETNSLHRKNFSFVFSNKNWHEGVVGIVASRVVERYYHPTFIGVEKDNGKIKGSARGIYNFSIIEALEYCKDYLEKYGGHKYAGGYLLKKENKENFTKALEKFARSKLTKEDLIERLNIDAVINFEQLSEDLIYITTIMEPFGIGNPKPVFLLENAKVFGNSKLYNDAHLSFFIVGKKNSLYPAIYFQSPYRELKEGIYDIVFNLDIRHNSLQIVVLDIQQNE